VLLASCWHEPISPAPWQRSGLFYRRSGRFPRARPEANQKGWEHGMTDQELRRLSRAELLDIIDTLLQQKEQAEQQLAQAQAQLKDKQLRIANAGSIAEAALALNGVFDAAQAAADQDLQGVRASAADMQAQLAQAQQQKQQILAEAEQKAQQIVSTAERQAAEQWKRFQVQAGQLIQAHSELREMFKGMVDR